MNRVFVETVIYRIFTYQQSIFDRPLRKLNFLTVTEMYLILVKIIMNQVMS